MDGVRLPRLALLLLGIVVPALWLLEVRPNLAEVVSQWPGHPESFRLPTYLPGDCPFYRATIRSLLHGHGLDLRDDAHWGVLSPDGQVALGARGEWYPKHPVAMSLAAVPFYAAFRDPGLLLFNLLQLSFLNVLLLVAARRFSSDAAALATAIAFALGTLLRPAAYNFSPDVFSTLLVFGGYLSLVSGRAALGGACLGAAVGAKWTNLVFVPLSLAWVVGTMGLRPALRFTAAAVPFLAALAMLNAHMFGSPWVTPYDRVGWGLLQGSPHIEPSHRTQFDQPFWSGMWKQMDDPRLGLLRSAPLLLFAIPGIVVVWRRARAEAVLLVAMAAAQVALFAPYRSWAASNFGHRFLLTVVALGAAPVAALLSVALRERPARPDGIQAATTAAE